MRLKRKYPILVALLVLAFTLICSLNARAAQIYHGDGATNNGSGGWATSSSASDQCLNCHSGAGASDMSAYLSTGHKNVLRKVAPNKPWAFSDGTPLRTTDTPAFGSLYNSGSTFDWLLGQITVGSGPDIPYSPNPYAGLTRDLFYIFGGWTDPSQLDTIWRGGFTGEQFASGNYDCARCHSTGYQFDNSAPEPTFGGLKISATDFSRVPTDYDLLDPASPNASWQQEGVTCERCHNADNGINNHTTSGAIAGGIPTKPLNESGTASCLQCHREESVDTTANTINPVNVPTVSDGGSCSDGVSPDYPTCTAVGQTWNYAPFFDHESGPTFLNSPHARFNGTLAQNAQNSPDLSVNLTGTYNSAFADPATGQNKGCMGCHDTHQSTTQSTATPFKQNCNDCHASAQHMLQTINHPTGLGTPFPTGTSADIPGSCIVCHMSQSYHLFRISTDPNYSTFPTAAQLNDPANPQTAGNPASDGKLATAVWSDVDLACGQCHVGSGNLFATPAPGAPVLTKARLAANAVNIHGPDIATITASAAGSGTITPSGPISVNPGGSQSFSIAANAGNRIAYLAVDGVAVTPVPQSYTFNNVLVNHSIAVSYVPITYTVTVTQTPNGYVTPYTYSGFTQGASQTYNITPNAGCHVVDVQVDGVSQGPLTSYTFSNIQTDHSITATYAINPSYTITVTQGANGTLSPSTTTVLGGLSQTFAITPNSGYVVNSVIVDGVNVGAVTSYSFNTVNGNHTITASFISTFTITASTTSTNGAISPAGSTTVPVAGSQSYAITANPGYKINYVAVNGVSVGAVASYTFNNVKANATIKADFVPITYTITVTQTPNGYVTPYTYSGFIQGANQTYKIMPNAGYHVATLTVDGNPVTSATSYPFTNIQANHSISATFAINPSYTITASVTSGSGTITPAGATPVVGGLNQKFTITPATGNKIYSVLVDGTNVGAVTSYTFYTVSAGHTIAATFGP